MHRTNVRESGSTLAELVIVIVIIGTITAIAIPRVSNAGKEASKNVLAAHLAEVREAIDLYVFDHNGRTPDIKKTGSPDSSGEKFVQRLVETTKIDGEIYPTGALGPYLRKWPANPFNGLNSVRIGGSAPGVGTQGWHYNPLTEAFAADDSPEHAGL
jgi:general secretion pathway protein G